MGQKNYCVCPGSTLGTKGALMESYQVIDVIRGWLWGKRCAKTALQIMEKNQRRTT